METSLIISNMLYNMNCYISHLDLKNNPLGNKGIRIVSKGIKESHSLVHLDVRSTAFKREGANDLFKALSENNSVICLCMGNIRGMNRNILSGKGIMGIEKYLEKTELLTFLNLEGAAIGNNGFPYLLSGIMKCKSLKVLDLGMNSLTNSISINICDLILKSNLRRLDLSQNEFGNEFITTLSSAAKDKTFYLTHLNLSSCGFSSPGIGMLFLSLASGLVLEHLLLDKIIYKEEEAKYLSTFISKNATLKSISSAGCELKDLGIKIVSEGFFTNFSLINLNFSENKLTDQGATFLAGNLEKMQWKGINYLNVSHNFIEVIFFINFSPKEE